MPDELLLDGQPFDRRTARDHGVNGEQLRRLLLAGSVRRVLNDVYVDARAPDDLAFRARCLRLKLPRGAALSRLTAAWLFGVELTLLSPPDGPMPVECTVPPGREPLSRAGVRSYAAPLDADVDLVFVALLPTDVARPDSRRAAPLAAAARGSGDRRRHVSSRRDPGARTPGRGGALRGRTRGRPGPVSRDDRRATHRVPGGESRTRLRLVDAAGFPRPEAQIAVPDDGSARHYRLDMGWRGRRVAVEYDGEEFHEAPHQRRHDKRRRDDLRRRFGWTVLGVGKGEVLGPSMVLEWTGRVRCSVEPRIARRRW